MAKSVGIIGTVIGKLGNAVGYRIKDSNNKMTQGFRVYQPNVTNPRTYAQAVQRARMKPINTFYRALKNIIDRGFEGKYYGNQCRLEFLRLAMQSFNGPYVPKGFNGLVPGPFTIANGSLPEIKAIISDGGNAVGLDLQPSGSAPDENVGAVSAALLAAFPFLKEGDQLTFIAIDNVNGVANVYNNSIVLDTSNEDALQGFTVANRGNRWQLTCTPFTKVIACAIILSREGDSAQHLRSKAVMTVSDSIVAQYFTENAQAAAVYSYMSADGTTDWPEVKINSSDIAQLVTVEVNTDMTAAELPAGAQALGFVTRSSENGIFFITSGENKVLVNPDGTMKTITGQAGPTEVTLKADYAGLALEYSSAYGRI